MSIGTLGGGVLGAGTLGGADLVIGGAPSGITGDLDRKSVV